MAIVTQHQQHALGPGVDTEWGNAIKLHKTYPLISSPLTPGAKAYNTEIHKMLPEWWNGPEDNTTKSDPDTDITLDCEPTGNNLPVDGQSLNPGGMLPGIVSIGCMNYGYMHGAIHGGGVYWGFNWLVHAQRTVEPSDIFAPHSLWLQHLTALVNADRNANGPPAFPPEKLALSDTTHWVVARNGLGFIYSYAELFGYQDGGSGGFVLIPWSKLRPYLNPHGIVPKANWNASPPMEN